MPPKQKEVKKGIAYKATIPAKDIIPSTVKEPPREPKPAKAIDNFGQIAKRNDFELKEKAEGWPGNEAAKTFDFAIESTVQWKDPQQKIIKEAIKAQHKLIEWKTIEQINQLRKMHKQQSTEESEKNETKSLHQVRYLDEEEVEVESEPPKPSVMIESYMRDENAEEMEKRKKEEAEKAEKAAKDKKKGKKQEVKEEGPVKVRDVQLADIVVHEYMLDEAKWIGSQLQIIKQRNILDCNTEEPIWKKIYPQVDGLPVLSKSGRYWVKLYFMGRQVKIEVDGELPVDSQFRHLFPVSARQTEHWTLIISKAVIKLTAIHNANCNIIGNGLVMYSLTGLIAQTINLSSFTEWNKIGELLSDRHYTTKDAFVTCYSSKKFKGKPPANLVAAGADLHKLIEIKNSEFQTKLELRKEERRAKSSEQRYIEPQPHIHEEIEHEVIPGYAYHVGDYLTNGNFNMVYAQKISLKQLRLRQQYNELTRTTLNNKARDEKLEYRKKKKEKKERIHLEEQKRENLLKKPPKTHHFLKICSNVKIHGDYSPEEIAIAKKCILNDLPYPPNYELPTEPKNQDGKSARSFSVINTKIDKEKEKDQMAVRPLEDFSSVPNCIQPLARSQKGVWVKDDDFISCFQYVQIHYDPNKLIEKQVTKVDYSASNEFTVDENKEVLILEKQEGRKEDTTLLFGFSAEYPKNQLKIKPYTMLQKFNFDEFSTVQNTPALDKNIGCLMLNFSNQNHVFKIMTVSRGGYCYWISSNTKFKLSSIAGYLTEFEGYTSKSFPCEYPAVEAEKYTIFFRGKVMADEQGVAILRLKGIDASLMKFLRYRVIDESPKSNMFEGVNDNKEERTLIVSSYLRLELKPKTTTYVVLEGIFPVNIPEGTLQVEALLRQITSTFQVLEQVEPARYVQKYQPNKYGVICRQRLFTASNTLATLNFQLFTGEAVAAGQGADKKAGKKGGKQEPQVEFIESQMKEKRTVRLDLYCDKEIVKSDIGFNEALFSGVLLKSAKEGVNYYLQASFDLRQWPEAKESNENTNKILWSLKIFSSDSVAVVRDTEQQDYERDVKKQWEDKEPGRAERAKKARRKYMLQLKQEAGEQLTEQQLKIVTAPRISKKQQLEEEKKAAEDKKGGKAAKKDDKKAGKQPKKQEVKPVEQKPKQWPKSDANVMLEVRDFLNHLEAQRVIQDKLQEDQTARVRSPDELRSVLEGVLMANQEAVAIVRRNIQQREMGKIKNKQRIQQLNNYSNAHTEQFKKTWKEYQGTRNTIFEKSKAKAEKERALVALIKSEKPAITEADLLKSITEYQAMDSANTALIDVLHMLRKNIRISALNEKLAAALTAFDIDEINRIDEQIKRDQIEGLTPQTLTQMRDLMEEAKKNPNYIAQKQAEMKKGKKGKK